MSENASQRNVGRWMGAFSFAFAAGVVALALVRVAALPHMGAKPNMSPWFAALLSPVLALMLLFLVVPLEHALRSWWFGPCNRGQSALFGLAGATILLPWVAPPLWPLALLVNPLSMRLVFRSLLG